MGCTATLVDRLIYHAQPALRRCAIVSRDGEVSYAELAERVMAQANLLGEAGIEAANVVGIACDEDVAHLVLTLAVAHLGATSCTVPSHESAQQQQSLLRRAGATWVIAGDGSAERVASHGADVMDPLLEEAGAKLLFSTSGTTGEPKIVCHGDSGLVAQAPRHVGPTERFACLASMEHNFAKRHRLYCVAEGATNVFLDGTSEALIEQCRAFELTTLHLSAYQAHELLGVPGGGGLRGLRLKLGGSHVPTSLRDSLRSLVTDDLQCGYGTTETGAIAFTDSRDGDAGESVGRALTGIEVRVMDGDGAPLETGQRGELAIRCDGMFLGYLGQPGPTRERLVDGWFHTGDVGHLDDQLRIHLGGRSDDMFVFNSINIHPQDIEAQILKHPAVIDAVVLPQPSPVHGEVPVALVVLEGTDAFDLRQLKTFVRAQAGVRSPRRFIVVDSIPRNRAGKVLRAEARALLRTERSR